MIKFLTITTEDNHKFCANMIKSLRDFSDCPVVIYCDKKTFDKTNSLIESCNVNVEHKDFDFGTSNYTHYGKKEFVDVTFKKYDVIVAELKSSSDDVVLIDTDIAFKGNPMDVLVSTKNSDYDLVFQTDSPVGTPICTGFFYVRNSEKNINFFEGCIKNVPVFRGNDESEWLERHEQLMMNSVLHSNYNQLNTNMKWTLFPVSFATNGHLYFSTNQRIGTEVVIHTNFCVGQGIKKERLESDNLWFMGDIDE